MTTADAQPIRNGSIRLVAVLGWLVALGTVLVGLAMLAIVGAPIAANAALRPAVMVAFAVSAVCWASVGFLLLDRRPDNSVGRYALVIGLGYSLSVLGRQSRPWPWSSRAPRARSRGRRGLAGRLRQPRDALGPHRGARLSDRARGQTAAWDRVVRSGLGAWVVVVVIVMTQRGSLHIFPSMDNPLAIGLDLRPLLGATGALTLTEVALVLFAPLVVASIVTRYRAAGTTERLQLRWFVSATIAAMAGIAALFVANAVQSVRVGEAALLVFAVSSALVPIAIGIAVLRYWLFEIDCSAGRSAGRSSAGRWSGRSSSSSSDSDVAGTDHRQQHPHGAASTLLAAGLFGPLRRRVQRAVDRRFDRSRYDGERLLATFRERLRDEVDLTTIERDLQATVDAAVRPSSVGLWLRGDRRGPGDDGRDDRQRIVRTTGRASRHDCNPCRAHGHRWRVRDLDATPSGSP